MARVKSFVVGDITTAGTFTISLPTYATNDLMLVWIATKNASTWSTPAGWTQYSFGGVRTATNVSMDLFYKIASSPETNPVFVQSGTDNSEYVCWVVTGVDTGTPIEALSVTADTGSTTTHSAPRPTSTSVNDLFFHCCSAYGLKDPTLDFGHVVWKNYAFDGFKQTGVSLGCYWEFQPLAAQVAQRTWTLNTAGVLAMASFCVKDASPSVTPLIPAYIPTVPKTDIAVSATFDDYITNLDVLSPPHRASFTNMTLTNSTGFGTFTTIKIGRAHV